MASLNLYNITIKSIGLAVGVLLSPTAAMAQLNGDPNMLDGGAPKNYSNTESTLQNVSFTPQSRSGEGHSFAPIGIITPNAAVPVRQADNTTKLMDGRATATLISPCYILTNFHAVYGDASSKDQGIDINENHKATFFVGDDPATGFKYHITATPVAHGDYHYHGTPQEDWALLHLDKCAGLSKSIGWMEISKLSWPQFPGQSLNLASYPGGFDPKELWLTPKCNGVSVLDSESSVVHSCPTISGSSGGMAVAKRKDGILLAVFMAQSSGPNLNIGVDLPTLVTSPKFDCVRDDLSKWGVQNPNLNLDGSTPTNVATIRVSTAG